VPQNAGHPCLAGSDPQTTTGHQWSLTTRPVLRLAAMATSQAGGRPTVAGQRRHPTDFPRRDREV